MKSLAIVLTFALSVHFLSFAQAQNSPIINRESNPLLKSPISLVAKDANLSEVLRVLSDRSGMNFVAGEGVNRERITIMLNNTPLDEAINLLVRAAGLSYEIIGNSVLIAEPGNLETEIGLSSYVVNLKYANAREVAEMLSDLTQSIKVDEGGNKLICYTSPRVILEIERIVNAIDQPHILVLLETRLIEVAMDRLDQYGINWSNLSPIQAGIRYPEAELTDGFDLNNWVRLPINFNVTLDMLLQTGDARLLMDSKLTTTNNREASLHIGEIIPYVIQTYNLTSAGVNQQIQREEVGVLITMTPQVNEEDQITLIMEPEVSNIAGWRGQNADIPLIRVRKTNTTVRVENGQPIFLAGLLSEEKSVEIRKLPVLGSVPLLGFLFQNRRTTLSKKNLIIEVVPHIIKHPSEISRFINSSGQSRQRIGSLQSPQHQDTTSDNTEAPLINPDPSMVLPTTYPNPEVIYESPMQMNVNDSIMGNSFENTDTTKSSVNQ
ncbi:General secretion pathway protein D [Chitinispirillum alkaliphilum]|nr:General secretion pathway protein D [Chitinispirillum alkaliphilum]